ncbi:hypothetical protein ABID25_004709 [Mesorhizobium abyssinicae]
MIETGDIGMRFADCAGDIDMHHRGVERQRLEDRHRLQLRPRRRFQVEGTAAPAEDDVAHLRSVGRDAGIGEEMETPAHLFIDGDGDVGVDRVAQHQDAPAALARCGRRPKRARHQRAERRGERERGRQADKETPEPSHRRHLCRIRADSSGPCI